MTNKEKLKAARTKLNGKFPMQFNCFYYKGLRITKAMYFGYDPKDAESKP